MSDENETPVYIVFKQDTIPKNNVEVNNFDIQCRDIVRDKTKQSLRTKIEVMRAEYERANNKRHFKFSRLVETVEKANAQDERNTKKFLDNVETIMELFSNQLTPLENKYKSIMNRLTGES